MFIGSCLLVVSALITPAAPELEDAMPVTIAGDWTIEVGPGTAGSVTLDAPVTVEIPPPAVMEVRDEQHPELPVFNPNGRWRAGTPLRTVVTQECSATGLVHPDSVRVRSADDPQTVFVLDKDYALDRFWGTIGRIEGGGIAAGQPVVVDYDCTLQRLDSIFVNGDGEVRLAVGEPGVGIILPPEPKADETAVVNIWTDGPTEKITDENVYPISFAAPPEPAASVAETLLPKTLAKLRAGEPVTIVAWGDSVTNGGGLQGESTDLWYQHQFHTLLQERFPQSDITLKTAAWPGGNSKGYMSAPPGSEYDFQRDVLDPQPDLVTIEFVNDAGLNGEALVTHYTTILEHLHGIGAEVALITPHFVRPDWMGVTTQKVDADPRPYVQDLRQFAKDNDIALADASAGWCRLWRQGIPYMTLEGNSINHPDARGHEIFAQALIGLFPEK